LINKTLANRTPKPAGNRPSAFSLRNKMYLAMFVAVDLLAPWGLCEALPVLP
jgi:hypothetical protein